ncbi:MAG TPA: CRTAC1 family protein [Thermoanaerobaculia bacterium]|nr:CRTAC1 family protein [Thermoanaerobaculia bacterium]
MDSIERPVRTAFLDATDAAGLSFAHRNGARGEFWYPELMHAGVALLDYDGDGWLDVYLVQSGSLPPSPRVATDGNRLYRNRGDGTFEDRTVQARVEGRGYGTGALAGDYDGDGWTDLYVTALGSNTLYRNLGNGAFEDVTVAAGAADPGYAAAATFLDFDRDGHLDLFVCHYVDWSPAREKECLGFHGKRGYCNPSEYPPTPDTLLRNDGNGTFTDVSETAGIRAARGACLGVVAADLDGDGWVDLYVANDQMANHLWINQRDGTFREEALLRGAALDELGRPEASMGIAIGDPDGDGDWDLFVTHLAGESNTYYSNEGGGVFRDVTDSLGLGTVSLPYTGFGTGFLDFDHDGRLDVFVANGKVKPGPDALPDYREPKLLLRGESGRYRDVTATSGDCLGTLEVSRGAAFGDLDEDGDLDVVVANNDGPARLLRNEQAGRRAVVVAVEDRTRPAGALGAELSLEAAGSRQRRLLQPSYSYGASNDPRAHFGLGSSQRVSWLRVRWPDGATLELRDLPVDRTLRVQRASPPSVLANDASREPR